MVEKGTSLENTMRPRANNADCIFIAFCCSCANGYDGSLLGSILAMTQFQDVFHVGTSGQQVSIITSLYSV